MLRGSGARCFGAFGVRRLSGVALIAPQSMQFANNPGDCFCANTPSVLLTITSEIGANIHNASYYHSISTIYAMHNDGMIVANSPSVEEFGGQTPIERRGGDTGRLVRLRT
jgi:hypothetical protein